MLIELAYRLIVEETPFIQTIRNNSITFITPVIEVDGREREVDTYYYNKRTGQRLPLMYWGKYVQHDNNRDGMGQYLKITKNFTKGVLEWHPTILHDLHEAQSYLYVSTGTGPYNTSLDPIAIDEWWLLGRDRSHGNGQARRSRRLHLRLLRWLGPQLPLLDRPHPQLLRPLLRSAELRPRRQSQPDPLRHPDQPRMVSPESAAALHHLGTAQQHQHPGIGPPASP